MNLQNVKLIYTREMRDQLRDRRTLFLIGVLPLLLYPLLGMSFFQLSQFLRNTAAEVLVLGAEELAAQDWLPPLVVDGQFDPALFAENPIEASNLKPVFPAASEQGDADAQLRVATEQLGNGKYQAVLYFPPGFGERLQEARDALLDRTEAIAGEEAPDLPKPHILYQSANEKSRVAWLRTERVLLNWRNAVMRTNLRDSKVPLEAARPFEFAQQDVSRQSERHAALWSKILPFILFIWALTGAFYPAVDVCAGEKERGTLETLLASPAQRREIVWGKLLTVMSFSMVTAVLNLASLGITGKFVLAQFRELGTFGAGEGLSLPPLASLAWLGVALLPVAALFSALCLACAALARSTKEGQYYLMPLLLVLMPLMLLPMSPGIELNLGNSLIPVTGVVLLLRSMIEGQYWQALPYVAPVVVVTLLCCLLAIRWAEEQFKSESVLFRESERLELGRWLVHLVRDRRDTPTFGQAVLCVVLMMVVQFFVNLAISSQAMETISFAFLAKTVFVSQVVCILFPALLMTLIFTRRPMRTLLLDRLPKPLHVAGAATLAVFMLPLGLQFSQWIRWLYPLSPEVMAQEQALTVAMAQAPYWWLPLLLIAVLPAVCEEIALRGFVLSGFRHLGHKWWAIGLSAMAFGLFHFFLQQKISAAALGVVIGLIAVQTGSLLCCMIFHALYNGMTVMLGSLQADVETGIWRWLILPDGEGLFRPWVLVACLAGAAAIIWWLLRLPYHRTVEETLEETRERLHAAG